MLLDKSVTEICNSALALAGVTAPITSIEEPSFEGRLCNRFYMQVFESMLAEHNWRFATIVAPLVLLKDDTGNPFTRFTYKYPVDCVRLFAVTDGPRAATPADTDSRAYVIDERYGTGHNRRRLQFRVSQGAGGRIILTNIMNAFARYISTSITADSYPPLFKEAMTYRLAASLVVGLAAGKEGTRAQLMQIYQLHKAQAIIADSGEAYEQVSYEEFEDRYRNFAIID